MSVSLKKLPSNTEESIPEFDCSRQNLATDMSQQVEDSAEFESIQFHDFMQGFGRH